MRVLMTGGGTGGHIYPAIAIADTIRAKNPDAEIEFVGVARGLEKKLVPAAGYRIQYVKITGFDRHNPLKNIRTAFYMITSRFQAKKILKEFRPDVVIGTGGYVSWPLLREASAMQIPTAVHESNAIPGRAVLQLEPHLDALMLNFEEAAKKLKHPEKAVVVGNPLRRAFDSMDRASARAELGIPSDAFVIVSCGGSQGAPGVNAAALELMRGYTSHHPEILHYHATGTRHYADFRARFDAAGLSSCKNLILTDYISDMPLKMAAADLMITRAGAMTVSEISRSGKCCIFIPSPYVAEDHQYKNAKVLADGGAGFVLRESELKDGALIRLVEKIQSQPQLRHEVEKKVKHYALCDANDRVYQVIASLLEKKK